MAKRKQVQTDELEWNKAFRDFRNQLQSEQVRQEREFAQKFLKTARFQLNAHIKGSKDNVLKSLWKTYTRAEIMALGDGDTSGGSASKSGGNGERQRMSKDAMAELATKVVAVLKSHKDGISSSDLGAELSKQGVELGGRSPKYLAETYGGVKVKSEGRGPGATYAIK